MKNFILLLFCLFFSCSTISYSGISKGYNETKSLVWKNMLSIVEENYGGIKDYKKEPYTVFSNIVPANKELSGIEDKYLQAIMSLSGHTRPYAVDVLVKECKDINCEDYGTSTYRAEEILYKLDKKLKEHRLKSSLQDVYNPF
jgi:hypothetical protein